MTFFYFCKHKRYNYKQNTFTMAKNNTEEMNNVNLIGNGTKIIGDLNSTGDVRIDGILEGNLNIKAKLILGQTGKITGEIICKNADIDGTIEGKLKIEEVLFLSKTAKIMGDIVTGKLAIEPGAIFTGNCNMEGNIKNAVPNQEKK